MLKNYCAYKGVFSWRLLMLALLVLMLASLNGMLAALMFFSNTESSLPNVYFCLSVLDFLLIFLVIFRIRNAVYVLGFSVILQVILPFGYALFTATLSLVNNVLPQVIEFCMSLKDNWLEVFLAGLLVFDSRGGGELYSVILDASPSVAVKGGGDEPVKVSWFLVAVLIFISDFLMFFFIKSKRA
ncbi:hypothetical protein V3H21_22230 [Vibrio parahaemolyticus]|uniref:hypothetical protein n=1 Tax=Vibrio parahaemolyticus TaxID=670 RepID=UPI003B675D0D